VYRTDGAAIQNPLSGETIVIRASAAETGGARIPRLRRTAHW
jgi:hypothetical protein